MQEKSEISGGNSNPQGTKPFTSSCAILMQLLANPPKTGKAVSIFSSRRIHGDDAYNSLLQRSDIACRHDLYASPKSIREANKTEEGNNISFITHQEAIAEQCAEDQQIDSTQKFGKF